MLTPRTKFCEPLFTRYHLTANDFRLLVFAWTSHPFFFMISLYIIRDAPLIVRPPVIDINICENWYPSSKDLLDLEQGPLICFRTFFLVISQRGRIVMIVKLESPLVSAGSGIHSNSCQPNVETWYMRFLVSSLSIGIVIHNEVTQKPVQSRTCFHPSFDQRGLIGANFDNIYVPIVVDK